MTQTLVGFSLNMRYLIYFASKVSKQASWEILSCLVVCMSMRFRYTPKLSRSMFEESIRWRTFDGFEGDQQHQVNKSDRVGCILGSTRTIKESTIPRHSYVTHDS
jgi:hypothetical protein